MIYKIKHTTAAVQYIDHYNVVVVVVVQIIIVVASTEFHCPIKLFESANAYVLLVEVANISYLQQ